MRAAARPLFFLGEKESKRPPRLGNPSFEITLIELIHFNSKWILTLFLAVSYEVLSNWPFNVETKKGIWKVNSRKP